MRFERVLKIYSAINSGHHYMFNGYPREKRKKNYATLSVTILFCTIRGALYSTRNEPPPTATRSNAQHVLIRGLRIIFPSNLSPYYAIALAYMQSRCIRRSSVSPLFCLVTHVYNRKHTTIASDPAPWRCLLVSSVRQRAAAKRTNGQHIWAMRRSATVSIRWTGKPLIYPAYSCSSGHQKGVDTGRHPAENPAMSQPSGTVLRQAVH